MLPLSRRRSALVVAPVLAGAVLATFAPVAPAATVVDNEVCQYNYDSYWRRLPITITGDVTTQDGTPIAPGASVAAGTKVQLRNATLKADQLDAVTGAFRPGLPDWIETFGYESGFLRDGSRITLNGYAAFEATNTVEGVQAPTPFSTVLEARISTQAGLVDESASSLLVAPAPIPTLTWTATGGPVTVRQAIGTKMGPVPVGRTGGMVRVNGTVYVEAELGAEADGTRLSFDCTVGDQATTSGGGQGADHTDRLPGSLTGQALRSPNFSGVVAGGPGAGALTDPVDLAVETSALRRAPAGVAASVEGADVVLRLTPDQVTAWLGNGGSATITGSVPLQGLRSVQGAQSAPVTSTTVTTPAAGQPLTVTLPLAPTSWTPQGDDGVDVRTADQIVLSALVGGTPRGLTLQRSATFASAAYPFAHVLGPDPRTPPPPSTGGPGPTNPPTIDLPGGGTIAPPPVLATPAPAPTPKPAAKTTSVRISAATLKRSNGRLKVALSNLVRSAGTTGRFSLVTKAKYRVGKKKAARITLLKATRFSLPKGKARTYAVKLTKDGAALLKARRSVKATLTVTPTKNVTQRTVTRSVIVRR